MKQCDVCKQYEKNTRTPAEYVQEWRLGEGSGILVDIFVCEEHLTLDETGKELLAQGHSVQIKRIEP